MLRAEDFPRFFQELSGHPPYLWQTRLAETVLNEGWPDTLDLPTGTGKTATLDIAVFAMALQAHAPRRVLMVVDRRLIVDQAFERAKAIAEALEGAADGVLAQVREALCARCGGEVPLEVAVLRGGIARDDGWARTPDQPLIAVSTVDQVGSRLLFRGYGVSPSMRPIHAGLLSHDTLLLLDEVHLSQPFADTLTQLTAGHLSGARALSVVRMSATPGDAPAAFRLAPPERAQLDAIVNAPKPVTRTEVRVRRGDDPMEAVAREAARQAQALRAQGARVIGVVVNRVDCARRTWRILQREGDAALLTGRMRPLDRDDRAAELLPRVCAGRDRARDTPLYVVATQCIEAGADVDFDALVTECASVDALRQRFGRLNRRGDLPTCAGVILMRRDQRTGEDPVYGEALAATWSWLEAHDVDDFGVTAIEQALIGAPSELRPAARTSPRLLPAYVRLLSQTRPAPVHDPEVALWLHGPQEHAPDVQIIWRADVTEQALRSGGSEALQDLLGRLTACPPSPLEALSVSAAAAWAWLCGRPGPQLSDVEGQRFEAIRGQQRRPALLWRGEDSSVLTRYPPPGATLIVPATYGGLEAGTWAPDATAPVPDLGDRAQWARWGQPVLRLHLDVLVNQVDPALLLSMPTPGAWIDPDDDPDEEIAAWLERLRRALSPGWLLNLVMALGGGWQRVSHTDGAKERSYTLVGQHAGRAGRFTSEDDSSVHTGQEVSLAQHSGDVRAQVQDFARHLGLPAQDAEDLALAAWLHDLGKADPRFQRLLAGGSAVAAALKPAPLAKSATRPGDQAARRRAWQQSGLPRGFRHELVSHALIADSPLLDAAHDRELVLHLVASHHGHCRPLAPPVPDPEAPPVAVSHDGAMLRAAGDHGLARVDSGLAERFERLNQRYGPWGLAWREAILRLADHRASEGGER
ncbi:MAG: type I-U CRISPR-associated helicase/endonuclease Cas3 [Alphaproteobacteria bacterium]|nr:type I-U CRISPR-associated helicase/endonuclease Cas3 [Alphaproteobacteria bacterium]